MHKDVYQIMYDHQQWHWWYQTKRAYLEAVFNQLSLSKSVNILDLGSGVGANFVALRKFGKVSGVEFSTQARKFSTHKHPESVVKGDLNTFHFPSNQFDVITILDVLYHQQIKDDQAVLKKIYKGLKKTGWLVVTDCAHPFLYGPHDQENMARQRYSKLEIQKKVQQAGFKIERCSYIFCFTFPLFVTARLIQKMTGKDDQKKDKPGFVNKVLIFLGRIEAKLLKYMNLPFGSSILIVAQK